jgi:anthranilate synthase component 1
MIHAKSTTVLADLQTPVSIYLKVRDAFPESALLESSDFHGNENSVSFIGVRPMARFEVKNHRARLLYPGGHGEERDTREENVPALLHRFVRELRGQVTGDVPYNGLFGYTAYDAARYFGPVDPGAAPGGMEEIPDMIYIFYRYLLAVNHFKNEMTVIENLPDGEESGVDELLATLANRDYASYNFSPRGDEQASCTDEEFKERARRGIQHCRRGDVFQVVLSRRFSRPFAGDDFKVYRALRSINPSPYLFYFDLGTFRVFGSSPEAHCVIARGRAYIDPIAGTFRRSGDDEKDKQLARALLEDPKENAEHVMLVDLARNDLARNTSNVRVEFFKEIQFYSHVIHLVSRVAGDIPPASNTVKIHADTFPAGTLTGAPKERAMQLIRDIEGARGLYGGCIGYIGLDGEINHAITIRSLVSKDNVLYYQAGAGIVARSNEETELQEVNNKLDALKKAIEAAARVTN